MSELQPGSPFGRYRILRRIGAGGMGEVYEASHVDLQKRVAIKVLSERYTLDPTSIQRFVLEARAASRLSHPNVVDVSDVGVEGGRPYMVMELLEGEDLFQRLKGSGPLSLEQTVAIFLPVISAVAAAHDEGVLHRDLKPENVLLARIGRSERPTLLDFGISQILGGRRLTDAGRTLGTPHYMSPEQFAARSDLDGRADQFALGVMLYECTTGQLPHVGGNLLELVSAIARRDAPPPSHWRPELPREFDDIVRRALAPERDERFANVRELGRALWPFGSVVTQAVWVEEFGDRSELEERISAPPPRRSSPSPSRPQRITTEHLRAFHAFEDCNESALSELAAVMTLRTVEAGARVIEQGSHAHDCFLLTSGEVEVVKEVKNQRLSLGTLGAGAIFGTIALLDHVPRTASIVATRASTVAEISRADFERLLAHNSDAAHRFRTQLAIACIRQLRRATKRLAQLLDQRGVPCTTADLAYVQAAAQEPNVMLPDEDSPETLRMMR